MPTDIESAAKALDPMTPAMRAAIAVLLPDQDAIAAAVAVAEKPPPFLMPPEGWRRTCTGPS